MAAEMPLSLYYEWLAYAQYYNPLAFSPRAASERLEWAIGANAAGMHNVMTALFAKFGSRAKPQDFMLKPLRTGYTPPQTAKQVYETFKAALIMGGQLSRKQ